MVADDTAIIVTIITGARFSRCEETDAGDNSEDGDDFFHDAELGVQSIRRKFSRYIQLAAIFFDQAQFFIKETQCIISGEMPLYKTSALERRCLGITNSVTVNYFIGG